MASEKRRDEIRIVTKLLGEYIAQNTLNGATNV